MDIYQLSVLILTLTSQYHLAVPECTDLCLFKVCDTQKSDGCTLCENDTKISCRNGENIMETLKNFSAIKNKIEVIMIENFTDKGDNYKDLLPTFTSHKLMITFNLVQFKCSCGLLCLNQISSGSLRHKVKIHFGQSSRSCVLPDSSVIRISELTEEMFENCERPALSMESLVVKPGDNVEITCYYSGTPQPRVLITPITDHYKQLTLHNVTSQSVSSLIESVNESYVGCYSCNSKNEAGYSNASSASLVLDKSPPVIKLKPELSHAILAIQYDIYGVGDITIRWTIDGVEKHSDRTEDLDSSYPGCNTNSLSQRAQWSSSSVHDGSIIRLIASNGYGSSSESWTVEKISTGSTLRPVIKLNGNMNQDRTEATTERKWTAKLEIIIPSIFGSVLVLLLLVIIVICQRKRQSLKNNNLRVGQDIPEMTPLTLYADMKDNPEYTRRHPNEALRILNLAQLTFIKQLGEGAFGIVFQGTCKKLTEVDDVTMVAIKTLKQSVTQQAMHDFEVEAEVMSDVKHENIVKFYGICYEGERLMMIFEFMEHGDLSDLLRSHGPDSSSLGLSDKTIIVENLNNDDLLNISLQIANGMAYLAGRHFVHRDLATRNCLVGHMLTVKIGDFGMSRDIYATDYYKVGGDALLPIRWMPPESIMYRRFTIESDTWSYGVVLWEIYSFGMQPWCELSNMQVIESMKEHKVLPRPDLCPPEIYELMLGCWKYSPSERLNMSLVSRQLQQICAAGSNVPVHNNNTTMDT